MKVVVYASQDGPVGHEFVGHIFYPDGKAAPVMIFGTSAERAREKAETWLAAEIERARPKERKPRKTAPQLTTDEDCL